MLAAVLCGECHQRSLCVGFFLFLLRLHGQNRLPVLRFPGGFDSLRHAVNPVLLGLLPCDHLLGQFASLSLKHGQPRFLRVNDSILVPHALLVPGAELGGSLADQLEVRLRNPHYSTFAPISSENAPLSDQNPCPRPSSELTMTPKSSVETTNERSREARKSCNSPTVRIGQSIPKARPISLPRRWR